MNFICTLSGLNVQRERYLENSFDAHVPLQIHFTNTCMYIYQHQSYSEKFKSKINKFFTLWKISSNLKSWIQRERELWHSQHLLSFLVETCKDTTVGLEKTNWRSRDLFPASLWCVVNRTQHCEMLAALSEKCLKTRKNFFMHNCSCRLQI